MKHFGRIFAFCYPVLFVFGIFRGFLTMNSPDGVSSALEQSARLELTPESARLVFPDVHRDIRETVYNYPMRQKSGTVNYSQSGSKPVSAAMGSDSMMLTAVVAISDIFGKTSEDPENALPETMIPRFPAFVASFVGYIPGYYIAVALRLGLNREIAEQKVVDPAFKEGVLNRAYYSVARNLSDYLYLHPAKRLSAADSEQIRQYLRNPKPTDLDRAEMHGLIMRYATNKGIPDLLASKGDPLSVACFILSVLGFAAWVRCSLSFVRNRSSVARA